MKLTLMYFSPTHTTKKIVSAVGKVFFEKLLCETAVADITPLAARMRDYTFGEEDILVFGAPVYGGRVASPAAEVLRGLHGNGARAVVVCVYGNRDYDDALLESRDLLEQAGFRVCAAAAFIGEHSYSGKVGARRPDTEDLLAAASFGIVAFEKVASGEPIAKKIKGAYPYKEFSAFMLAPKAAPETDAGKCTRCGACISLCPVCNIGADLSDGGRCIACAACVKFCPAGARRFTEEGILSARKRLEENCTVRRQPEFYI